MKTIENSVHQLLKSYSKYYQTSFKLVINHNVFFSNFIDDSESTSYSFKIKNDDSKLICSKENFEKELEIISIAVTELMEEEDICSLLEKGIKEPLNSYEKDKVMELYHSNQYTVVLIETKNNSEYFYEILQSMVTYPMCELIKNNRIVVLLPNDIDQNIMMELKDTLEAELYCRVYISVSSLIQNIDDLQKAYEEASLYLDLMKKYDVSVIYANQNDCLLPYVVDNIDVENANAILSKLDKDTLNQIDEELLNTIQVFLRNNLSIAETSRQLYLHRNTLIYRLEKIMTITGLDIRNFKDAVKMEILLLLKKRFN